MQNLEQLCPVSSTRAVPDSGREFVLSVGKSAWVLRKRPARFNAQATMKHRREAAQFEGNG